MSEVGTLENPLRVAIVGAGPTGFYTAEHLFKRKDLAVEVDMFDSLPTPFGLVRAGELRRVEQQEAGADLVSGALWRLVEGVQAQMILVPGLGAVDVGGRQSGHDGQIHVSSLGRKGKRRLKKEGRAGLVVRIWKVSLEQAQLGSQGQGRQWCVWVGQRLGDFICGWLNCATAVG